MKKTIAVVLLTLAAPATANADCWGAQDYTTCKQLEEINKHLENAEWERRMEKADAERREQERIDREVEADPEIRAALQSAARSAARTHRKANPSEIPAEIHTGAGKGPLNDGSLDGLAGSTTISKSR